MGDDNLALCPTCKHKVSKSAVQCPNCGERFRETKVRVKTSRLTWFIGALIFIPMVWGLVIGNTKKSENIDKATQPTVVNKTSENHSTGLLQTQKKENWEYNSETDTMRGEKNYGAINKSINSANFDFPYQGENHLYIKLVKNKNENIIVLIIDKGQILCDINDGCYISVKFDNSQVEQYSFHSSSTGDSTIVFLNSDQREQFFNGLKKSKRVIIEPTFFQEGNTQFTFDVSGFKWNS